MANHCFVCGMALDPLETFNLKQRKGSLKWVFIRVCEIVGICPEEEWDCLVNCVDTLCCTNCSILLKSIWETHQSLVQIQKTLKKYICQVKQNVQESVGAVENLKLLPPCLQFRHQFANSTNDLISKDKIVPAANDDISRRESTLPDDGLDNLPTGSFKTERDTNATDQDHQLLSLHEEITLSTIINQYEGNTVLPEVTPDESTILGQMQPETDSVDLEASNDDIDWQNESSDEGPSTNQRSKKRKFVVIAEEDDPLLPELTETPEDLVEQEAKKPRRIHSYKYSPCGTLVVCRHEGCSYSSKWPRNVLRHEQRHLSMDHREDKATCPECGRSMHKDSLTAHIRRTHRPDLREEDLVCPDCGKTYLSTSKGAFDLHVRSHREEKTFLCDICSMSYLTAKLLEYHTRTTHESEPIHCEHCGKTYGNKRAFRTHWKKRHLDKIYPAHLTNRFDHRVTASARKKRVRFCDHEGCTYSTVVMSNMRRHKNTHLPFDQRTNLKICPHCGVEFSADTLRAHIRRFHGSVSDTGPVLVCPECGKKFLSRDKAVFEAHLKVHRGELDFVCDECGKGFVEVGTLNAHRRQVHRQINSKCEQCERHFVKFSSYRDHWRKDHSQLPFPLLQQARRIRAPVKGMESFYNHYEVERKAKEMMPERKWPCDICETICSTKQALQKHMRRIHRKVTLPGRMQTGTIKLD